jgi:hypothetical protein
MSRQVKHRKMENLDPRQVQTNRVTVIKLGKFDDADHINKWSEFHSDRARGLVPTTTWNITLLWLLCMACSPLSPIIFLLTSTGQTGEPIFMVDGSNDAFTPKEVPFLGLIEKNWLNGVSNPKNRQKVGVVYDFPAKLENSIKTHISVKSRDIDTKFEP